MNNGGKLFVGVVAAAALVVVLHVCWPATPQLEADEEVTCPARGGPTKRLTEAAWPALPLHSDCTVVTAYYPSSSSVADMRGVLGLAAKLLVVTEAQHVQRLQAIRQRECARMEGRQRCPTRWLTQQRPDGDLALLLLGEAAASNPYGSGHFLWLDADYFAAMHVAPRLLGEWPSPGQLAHCSNCTTRLCTAPARQRDLLLGTTSAVQRLSRQHGNHSGHFLVRPDFEQLLFYAKQFHRQAHRTRPTEQIDDADRNKLPRKRRGSDEALLVFYVIGDWGTARPQLDGLTTAMHKFATAEDGLRRPQFVVSAGDHGYRPERPLGQLLDVWRGLFLRFDSLRVPWYPVLGNHDVRFADQQLGLRFTGGDQATGSLWRLVADHYRLAFSLDDGQLTLLGQSTNKHSDRSWLELFFFDTNALADDGDAMQQQMDWLRAALAGSSARWKLTVAHHPLYSVGTHRASPRQLRQCYGLEDLLVNHSVAAHLAGHTHLSQHFEQRGVHSFVCGNSGARRTHHFDPLRPVPLLLPRWHSYPASFAAVSVFLDRIVVDMVGRNASVLYSATIPQLN